MKNNLGTLSLKEIQERLGDRRLSRVQKATGLSFPTLKKLSDGTGKNYTIRTLQKVSDYLLET